MERYSHPARSELVVDTLHVTGGIEPADGRISWVPRMTGAHVPINSYLLCHEEHCVIVDCGLPAHEDVVLAAANDLATVKRMTLAITRGVEFDSMGNATALLRTLPIEAVYAHFPSAAWFRFDPRFDASDDGSRQEAAVEFRPLRAQDTIALSRDGSDQLEALDPGLRLLQTTWLFHARTGTLFTSDAFGYARTGRQSRIIDSASDHLSCQDIEEGLAPKFGWLRDADVRPTCDALVKIFAERDVQVIAPTVGCVLRGREVVQHHVELLLDVLGKWGESNGL